MSAYSYHRIDSTTGVFNKRMVVKSITYTNAYHIAYIATTTIAPSLSTLCIILSVSLPLILQLDLVRPVLSFQLLSVAPYIDKLAIGVTATPSSRIEYLLFKEGVSEWVRPARYRVRLHLSRDPH